MSVPLRLRAAFGAEVPTPSAEPVTVTVARVVRADQREAFERWADDVLQVAANFPGNLGTSLLHPGPDSSEYHLVYRFEDDESLAAWERSPERRAGPAPAEDMGAAAGSPPAPGPESFFPPPPKPRPPRRAKPPTDAAGLPPPP